jgi:hypothetical protein
LRIVIACPGAFGAVQVQRHGWPHPLRAPCVATDTAVAIVLKTRSRSCVFTAGDFLSAPNFAQKSTRQQLCAEIADSRIDLRISGLINDCDRASGRRSIARHLQAAAHSCAASHKPSSIRVWKDQILEVMRTTDNIGRTTMRTALLLSTVVAGVPAVATTTFAQNYGAYAQAVGEAAQATTVAPGYGAPLGRFTRPDVGYRGGITTPRNKTARPLAPAIDGPAPAQER